MSTNKAVKKGVFWIAIERFASQILQFVISIIVARILSPSDYGLIAMLGIFLGISQVFVDSGFYDALIQKKEKTDSDYNTAFFFNISIGLATYIVFYFAAPLIARFYEQPELTQVARVLGLLPFITALGLVVKARMAIALRFRAIALSGLVSVCISGGIAIWMAYAGWGVWALIFQTLCNYFLSFSILWFFDRWTPTLNISKHSLQQLWRFGSHLLLTGVIDAIYTNLYTLLIGKRYSVSEAGSFNRAQTLSMFPALTIASVLLKVYYPIQCKLTRAEEQQQMFIQSIRWGSFVVFPLMFGIIALAEPLVLLLLKEKWLSIVPLLRICCLGYLLHPVILLNNNMLSIKGRTDISLRAEIVKKLVGFLLLASLISFDLFVFCFSLSIYMLLDWTIVSYYVQRIAGIKQVEQIKQLFPSMCLALVMACVSYGSIQWIENPLYQLLVGTICGIVSYAVLATVFKLQEMQLLKELIWKKTTL